MGAIIDSVAFAKPGLNPFRKGSVDLEMKAGKKCLRRAKLSANDLEVIINAGVYRDKHIGEPSIASFLQRRMGANNLYKGVSRTFSFDLNNGGCGFLTGIRLVNGFIESGTIECGMVAAGDVNSDGKTSIGFDLSPSAAAIILSKGSKKRGFLSFHSETFPEQINLFKGELKWEGGGLESGKRPTRWRSGNRLRITMSSKYARLCSECSALALIKFLKQLSLKLEDIDLIIPSQYPENYPALLSEITVMKGMKGKILAASKLLGNPHTAGIGGALDIAFKEGRFQKAKNVIFLSVGSGITIALAYYRNGVNQKQ